MSKKKNGHHVGSDFAGFDAKPLDQFMKLYPKSKPDDFVYIFAHTWYDARAVALTYFKNEQGYCLDYSEITGELLNEGEVAIEIGSVLLRKDEAGGAVPFTATRKTDREAARRGEGIGKRKPVALETGCVHPRLLGGVQTNGQEAVHVEGGGGHQGETSRPPGWQGNGISSGYR